MILTSIYGNITDLSVKQGKLNRFYIRIDDINDPVNVGMI